MRRYFVSLLNSVVRIYILVYRIWQSTERKSWSASTSFNSTMFLLGGQNNSQQHKESW